MQKKWFIVLTIVEILLVILIVSLVFYFRNTSLSPNNNQNQSILENCNTLNYNNKQATNLVFISSKEQAQEYSDFLLESLPFSLHKEGFNIYYLDNINPECELYKGIAVFCYNKDIIKKSSSCPNDIIIVVKDESPSIRSSAYMNVISINSQSPKTVLLHEFGHAFANLADEYIPSSIPKKSKNCVSDCTSFASTSDGCFPGCSESSYYRSIDSGIMKTLYTSDYGVFNTRLIETKISDVSSKSSFTGNAVSDTQECSQQSYLLVNGVYSNSQITISDKTTQNGCLGTNGVGAFSYKLILNDNSEYIGDFNPELMFTDTQSPENTEIIGGTTKYEGQFSLKLPLVANSKSLEILEGDQKLSEINLLDIDSRPCKK